MTSLDVGVIPGGTERLLGQAEERCAARGARLTAKRRLALRLLLEAPAPLGAYELLERLRAATGHPTAPTSVYRTLDFLMGHGLVHRIERLNAFVPCSSPSPDVGADAARGHQFLLCRGCGAAAELRDAAITRVLAAAAARSGFHASGAATVEVEGLCARCSGPATMSREPVDGRPARRDG